MQRAIAVELKLDDSVIEIIDKTDEEDDFKGVDEGSRSEIMSVAEVIDQVLRDHKFMVAFHNGSGDYIDLGSFGFPQITLFRSNLILWTFRKRFQGRERYSEIKDKVKNTHLFAYETEYYITRNKLLFPVLQKEAAAIAAHYPCMREIDPERINEWAARASVYWMCDGIIQGDQAWEISAALSKEIKWDLQPSLQDEVRQEFIESSSKNSVSIQRFKNKYFDGQKFYPWITITASHNINPETLQDIRSKNAEASSYFLAPERSSDITLVLSDGLFDQWNNLQVLQLSYCDFSFASSPFIGCQNLRFIGLDHCKDKKEGCKQSDLRKWQFLHSLLVLDLIDTIWYQVFSEDMADLFVNLRELNIVGVDCSHIWGQLQNKIEYVDLSRKRNIKLPSTLRFFRLDNRQPTPQSTPGIELSLKGCMGLESFFMSRISNLTELDLSGTAIRILDFTTMVMEVTGLKRLFLLGCEQLRKIKWGEIGSTIRDLELLCIDTRPRIKYPQLFVDKNKSPGRLSVHAVIVDARIARSLWGPIGNMPYDVDMNIHVTSSTIYGEVQSEGTYKDSISQLSDHVNMQQQDLISAGQYHDVQLSMAGDVPMQSFPLPPTTMLSRHIEIAQGSHNLESELDLNSPFRTLAHLVNGKAESLHVHDLSTITPLPGGQWSFIRWCRIERCPKIEIVFPKYAWKFDRLETIWVSDLLMARCIWSKGSCDYPFSFNNLQHLHLRSCPRLQFVLPVWVFSFPDLKTLHVIHCSNLHNIFVLDGNYPEQITIKGVAFPKLTTIHLHDLPMLRQICDVEFKMVAPALQTIKIRGCWSLRRLPTVVAADGPKPAVEIEKDVWDALEWDGVEANHHPSLFQAPVHSRYYKKKLPRGSVLSGDFIKQMKASCFCTKVH
uniref:Disease resistance protein At4g27190-like leucine-rich repeats domain-containing protein n=1 Tax=Oryza glumipatula TaxID=40148 RepID=A0A0D9ZKX4_9ORYZ